MGQGMNDTLQQTHQNYSVFAVEHFPAFSITPYFYRNIWIGWHWSDGPPQSNWVPDQMNVTRWTVFPIYRKRKISVNIDGLKLISIVMYNGTALLPNRILAIKWNIFGCLLLCWESHDFYDFLNMCVQKYTAAYTQHTIYPLLRLPVVCYFCCLKSISSFFLFSFFSRRIQRLFTVQIFLFFCASLFHEVPWHENAV